MRDWNPGTLLGLSGQYWQTCALHAAVKLGVFDALGDQPLSGEEVARQTATEPDACLRLLGALTALGLVSRQGADFANTPASRRWLCRDSDAYLGFMILHHHYLMESWAQLDQAVRTGEPVRQRSSRSEDTREAFLMGMFNNAMLQAPELVRQVDLTGRRRLLDLGGGPGTYAVHFCLDNPGLSAVVFDLPATRPFAEKTFARFNLEERIAFQPGDFTRDRLGQGFDVVWMSHILHGEGPGTCRELVAKAAQTLEPGGELLIHEFILSDAGDGPLFPALFSLNMLTGTEAGRSYTGSELEEMMDAAGLWNIERLPYQGPTESGILRGRKK